MSTFSALDCPPEWSGANLLKDAYALRVEKPARSHPSALSPPKP